MAMFDSHDSSALLKTFATIGVLFLASKVYSYVRLLLDLFVLNGINVSDKAPDS